MKTERDCGADGEAGGVIPDDVLADELIRRLNELIDSGGANALDTLIRNRVPVDLDPEHPTIQVSVENSETLVGFLGMLNGIVGAIPDGPRAKWGYIAVRFADEKLISFERTSE